MTLEQANELLKAMNVGDIYTLDSIDYNALYKLALEGHDWAKTGLDFICGNWLMKVSDNGYEIASYSSETYPIDRTEAAKLLVENEGNSVLTDSEAIYNRLIADGYIEAEDYPYEM